MNQIAKLLPPSNVVVGLEASSKKRLFEQVGLLFENNHGIARNVVYDALFRTRKTRFHWPGPGDCHSARPHQGAQGCRSAPACVWPSPVQFDSPDGKPVSLAFVLLVPEAATERHLQLLVRARPDVLRSRLPRTGRRGAAECNEAMHQTLSANGRPMRQLRVAQLFEQNRGHLQLTCVCGALERAIKVNQDDISPSDLVGHLNLIHPDRIQVVGTPEISWAQAPASRQGGAAYARNHGSPSPRPSSSPMVVRCIRRSAEACQSHRYATVHDTAKLRCRSSIRCVLTCRANSPRRSPCTGSSWMCSALVC